MRVSINNVKMINSLDLSLDSPITAIIGEQASGKSTIAKIVYLAHFLPRSLTFYITSFISFSRKEEPTFEGFQKEFETQVLRHMPDVETGTILFSYSDDYYKATISFRKKEVKVSFNEELVKHIGDYISRYTTAARKSRELYEGEVLFPDAFHVDDNACAPFYIPAGRGALLSISEQMQGSRMVPSQDEFALHYIRSSVSAKRLFRRNAAGFSKWNTASSQEKKRLFSLFSTILKGNYEQDTSGNEFLRVEGKNELVEVHNASSGQQEILYPLMFLLDEIMRPGRKRLIIFEEPEAHLHPKSQKAVVELISYVSRHSHSRFLITTHSPYILTSFNPLILSGQIEHKGARNPIVYPEYRLEFGDLKAFSLTASPFSAKMINCEDGTIDATDIDTVSDSLNDQIFSLMEKSAKVRT